MAIFGNMPPISKGVVGSASVSVFSSIKAAFGGSPPEGVRAYTLTAGVAEATIGNLAGTASYIKLSANDTFILPVSGKNSDQFSVTPGGGGTVNILAWE